MSEEILSEAERALAAGDAEAAERALTRQWNNPAKAPADALHLWGAIRMAQRRLGDAEEFLRRAVKSEPKALRHHIALGHALSAAGNSGAAAEAYANAIKIDPNWPGLHMVYARACYASGRAQDAEAAARKAVQQTANADSYDALSNALRAQNKADEALAAADDALKVDSSHDPALHSRGAALLALGRADEALEVFDILVARGVTAPVLWLNRGAALEQLGRVREAQGVYDDAQRRWPHHPNLQDRLAQRRPQ